jgi:hypothetical protein
MSKFDMLVIILPVMLIGCSQSKEQEADINDNVLLAKEVTVTSPAIIANKDNPEWTKSLDRKAFIEQAFKLAMKKAVPIYAIVPSDFQFEDIEHMKVMDPGDIPDRMAWQGNDRSTNEIKEIWFYERWSFNKDYLKLNKEVLGWSPIRVYEIEGKGLKKLIFFEYPKAMIKGKKIAESIIYEKQWFDEYPTTSVGFDKLGFLKYIIEGIKNGKIDPFDPIYLVDKSKRKFTPDELAKYIGQDLNPGLINFSLSSMLFEEDWYFDEHTFAIQKEVKSIAFVQDNYDPEKGTSTKKILFFIFPK